MGFENFGIGKSRLDPKELDFKELHPPITAISMETDRSSSHQPS